MGLLQLLLPEACAGCGRFGVSLCRACLAEFRPASGASDRFVSADRAVVVGDALELAIAAFVHEGALRRALQRLKYGGAARLATPLARAALPSFATLLAQTGRVALVPVPVHQARQRQRGYNQAELLARELGRAAGVTVIDALVRTRQTARQHGLGRAARLHNLRGALDLRGSAPPPPAVIVVDDILTTSATLEACAEALTSHGCRHVFGFAIAREV